MSEKRTAEKRNPRWTRNDEKKYRTAIKKLHNATEETIGVLETRRDYIRRLKDALATSQTKIRDALEFHQNENVRYFTYATVIFLPLGFAASIYSMSGVPDHAIVLSLIKFAAAALAVTIAFLLSVRLAFKIAGKLLSKLIRVIWIGMNLLNLSFGLLLKFELAPIASTRGGVVVDKLLQPSARRVSRAVSALRKEQNSGSVFDVLLGVFFTPIFVASWLVKGLIINILDLLQACGKFIPKFRNGFHGHITEILIPRYQHKIMAA